MSNVSRALVRKKELMLVSKSIDLINYSDIYNMYKDLYLSEKEHEKKPFQDIQLVNGLKTQVNAKKADCKALAVKMPLKRVG